MANNYLITGYWGEPHVTPENDRGIHAGLFGTGRFVLPVGEQFRAEYIGNNTVRMYDGKLMDNGAAAGIPAGKYVDLLIANASTGFRRNDIIAFRYTLDNATLIERGEFIVIRGPEDTDSPVDPEYTQNNLLSNTAKIDHMPLYRVQMRGSSVYMIEKMFTLSENMAQAAENASNAKATAIDAQAAATSAQNAANAANDVKAAADRGDFNGKDGANGTNGKDGKSAYQYAQEGGYAGTEADFADDLAFFTGQTILAKVDEEKNVTLRGLDPTGVYTFRFDMDDGTYVEAGQFTAGSIKYHLVSNNLTNCTNNNSMVKILDGTKYSAKIYLDEGCAITFISVFMGGVDITSTAVNGRNINIANVTGDLAITIAAAVPIYTNLFIPSQATINTRLNSSNALVSEDGVVITNFIDVSGTTFTDDTKIYIKGANFDGTSATKVCFYKTSGTLYTDVYSTVNGTQKTPADEGNGVVSVSGLSSNASGAKRMCFVLRVGQSAITEDDIKNIIITIDEPIG